MRALPSCSSLQRATTCTASVVLEQEPETEQSASAKRGQLIHAVIAAKLRAWPMPDLGRYRLPLGDDTLAALSAKLGEGELRAELAMAYDGKRVHVLGENVGRGAYLPGELNGSADLVVLRDDAIVCDIKTGSRDVEPPAANWQLASLALFVSLAYSVRSVTGMIAKLGRDGSWTFAEHRWSLDDMAVVRARLDAKVREWGEEQALYDAGLAEPQKSPSAACYFCRAHGCENARTQHREAA